MENEVIIRDPHNKRIRKIIKVDISREIQNECQKSMEFILFTQSQQITQLFSLLDVKHSWGIISELGSAVLGIDEYDQINEKQLKRYSTQYQRCYDKLNYGLTNISNQLIFTLENIPDNCLDQPFIKKTIETIIFLQEKYINNTKNNILPVQKELLNGCIKKLIKVYNERLDNAIYSCEQNNSWWSKAVIFSQSINSGYSWLHACNNVLVYSENQNQFKQYLINNKLNINFIEIENLEYDKKNEISNT